MRQDRHLLTQEYIEIAYNRRNYLLDIVNSDLIVHGSNESLHKCADECQEEETTRESQKGLTSFPEVASQDSESSEERVT